MGTLLLWVGIFNSINFHIWLNSEDEYNFSHTGLSANSTQPAYYGDWPHPWKYVVKDCICFVVGALLLVSSGTWWQLSCIFPIDAQSGAVLWDEEVVLDFRSPKLAHARQICRCLVSVTGQCSMWLASWDFLEYYFPGNVWRELVYIQIGIISFLFTKTYISRTQIDGAENYEVRRPLTAMLMLRSVVSMIGSYVHITGAWTFFDGY